VLPPKTAALLLWIVLWIAVALLVAMTWHPWVIGSSAGCDAGTTRAWDGHCYGTVKR
jgi:hypothetical protein